MTESSKMQVLLLDPNLVTRVALATRLEEAGFGVRAEKDIAGAMNGARSQSWDLLLANTGVPLPDLRVLLEGLASTENVKSVALACDNQDQERKALANELKVQTVEHPIRPRSLRGVLDLGGTNTSSRWLPIVPKPGDGAPS